MKQTNQGEYIFLRLHCFSQANMHLFVVVFSKVGDIYIYIHIYRRHYCDVKAKNYQTLCVWDCVWQASASNEQWQTRNCVAVTSESQNNSQDVYFLSPNQVPGGLWRFRDLIGCHLWLTLGLVESKETKGFIALPTSSKDVQPSWEVWK